MVDNEISKNKRVLSVITALKPIVELQPVGDRPIHDNPVLDRVLRNRGVQSMDEMSYSLSKLLDPFLMMGMQQAAEAFERHLRRQSRVVVIGDFDCDGATSTAIAVEGLRLLGFKDVRFQIPDRRIHGYGLTPGIVKLAGELEPDLIVTVDSGISNVDGGLAVKALPHPCELIITDHHLAGTYGLPEAVAIVNPNQPNCPFPSKHLAGCGVIFYTMLALRSHLRKVGYFEEVGVKEPNLIGLIDLVAVGTVADVVKLDQNNRNLIKAGVERIRVGKTREGILALITVARREHTRITAQDFGFMLGPRINAAGRLEDMTLGVNCLLSTDKEEAKLLAGRLEELNLARRDIEADHVVDANALIEKFNLWIKHGVVLHDRTWHPGVVGIVASRVKDKLNRPVICMTDTDALTEAREALEALKMAGASAEEIAAAQDVVDNCDVKGSARSHPLVHLKHLLDKINAQYPGLLSKFGGHAMAAGLSLKSKNLPQFMEVFDHMVSLELSHDQMIGSIDVDLMNIDSKLLTMDLAKAIQNMGPWGQLFPEPVFHAKFKVESWKATKDGKHIQLSLSVEGRPELKFKAISFGTMVEGKPPFIDSFDGAFTMDINVWQGNESVQLMIRNIQDPKLIQQLERDASQPASPKSEEQPAIETTPVAVSQPANKTRALPSTSAPVTVEEITDRTDPSNPQCTKLDGLSRLQPAANGPGKSAAELRANLQSVVQQIKSRSVKPQTTEIDDGAAPF
ncbi:single-stranded-DNA-specific exonuclease RecJ [Pseudomonas serbica]|uniref:single-stranded-DNA-specific exonuclease RecJ n=1 Tax=Pseudomonas serbica TaxID=2965074 RepID=UPI00237B5075|nr:DHH family phosphoesterase [Pseudomonas serbica]